MPVAEGRKHTSLHVHTAGKRALSLCILLHANALLPAKRKYVNALLQGARRIIHNSMLAYSYLLIFHWLVSKKLLIVCLQETQELKVKASWSEVNQLLLYKPQIMF